MKLTNTYVHAESIYKNNCRSVILAKLMSKFPFATNKSINTVTLGGEDFKMEKRLQMFYNTKGISYEMNTESFKKAKLKAPKNITVINDNIFNHKYIGKEQFIWFDFMTALRYKNVNQLIEWIINNTIINDTVFAVTYTLHCRQDGYKQVFDNENEHEHFIQEIGNYIAMYLENDYVYVEPNISIVRYCNIDINKKSLPMVQYVFTLSKKYL